METWVANLVHRTAPFGNISNVVANKILPTFKETLCKHVVLGVQCTLPIIFSAQKRITGTLVYHSIATVSIRASLY